MGTPRKDDIHSKASVIFAQEYKGVSFETINGDILETQTDALVSSVDQLVSAGTGLISNVFAKAGQGMQEHVDKLKKEHGDNLPVGTVFVTPGGTLQAKQIIHVVTPPYNGGANKEDEKLGEAVVNALKKANELTLKSIAVPSLDGGVFGFPKEKAAEVIVNKCIEYLDNTPSVSFHTVKFVNADAATVKIFKNTLQRALGLKLTKEDGSPVLAREEGNTETQTEEVETQEVVVQKKADKGQGPQQALKSKITEGVAALHDKEAELNKAVEETVHEKQEHVVSAVNGNGNAVEEFIKEQSEQPEKVAAEVQKYENAVEETVHEKQEHVVSAVNGNGNAVEEFIKEQSEQPEKVAAEVQKYENAVEEIIQEKPEEKENPEEPNTADTQEKATEQHAEGNQEAGEEKTTEQHVTEEKAVEHQEAPVEEKPVEQAAVVEEQQQQEAPVEQAPVEEQQQQEAPVEQAPVEEQQQQEAPVEQAPVEEQQQEAPVENKPVEQQEAPVEGTEETKAEETVKEQEDKEVTEESKESITETTTEAPTETQTEESTEAKEEGEQDDKEETENRSSTQRKNTKKNRKSKKQN